MSAALRRIDRALHAAQNQSRQHRFLRRPFDLIQKLLQLLRMDVCPVFLTLSLFAPDMQPIAEIS